MLSGARFKTLHDLIDALPRLGDRRAVGFRGEHGTRWWTYRELHAHAHRAAAILARYGLTRGQRMLLQAPNSPEWVAFFLGAALRGIVVVPVDAHDSTERLLEIARLTEAVFLVDEQKNPLIGIPRHDIYDLDADDISSEAAHVDSDDPAVILFTSGSTGAPRGVVLTHGNLLQQVAPFLRFRAPLRLLRFRLLALSPLSHVQGLILGLCIPLSIGLIVLYTHSVAPAHLIRTIRAARIRFLSTVPRVLDLLEQELRALTGTRGGALAVARVMGRRFRVILVGGATLPPEREGFWRRSAIAVVQGYGMTETSALATINIPLLGRAGSIGFEVHRASIRIADDGEVLVRGPHVARTFIGDDANAFTDDGYLRTGDVARRDSRKRLFFLGRKKEVLVTAAGYNVHPATIEQHLLVQEGVRDAVVLGVNRDGFDELHAALLLDRGAHAEPIVQAANLRLPPHERIGAWTVWPDADFPRGVLHKSNRAEIARRVSAAAPAAVNAAAGTLDDCITDPDPRRRIDRLARYFADHREQGPNAEALMLARGADSIDVLQVLSRIESAPAEVQISPDVQSPSWPFTPGLGIARTLLRRTLLDPLLAIHSSVTVEGVEHLANIDGPCFFALIADGRIDRLDYLRVYRALPRRLRRRIMFVMASAPAFATYVRPAGEPLWFRLWVAFLFRAGVPLFFPFTLFPTPTRSGTAEGLRRACISIDRGFAPLSTWGRGTAIMATETQLPVVPVRMRGHARAVTIELRAPILPHPARSSDALHALVEQQ